MATTAAEPLAPGILLKDRYEIVRLIKGGGMSWVYQVREHRREDSPRLWALKELRMDADDRHSLDEARQLFEQEAHLLVQLAHPNLPQVAAYFVQGERSYLVMEFIHGHTLLELLNQARAPLLEGQVIPWAIQICNVLDYLHTRQPSIIFRDVKPSNVMVTPNGQIKLIDFGIARTYKVGQPRDTITMGSENYAAPEQWGQGQTDPRSDIYSLGATLYHLLTNQAPLPAYVPGERLPIRQCNPAVSERMAALVERAMAFERGDRFHSAAEMRAALLRCLPPWERPRKLSHRLLRHAAASAAVPTAVPVTAAPASPLPLYCRACGAPNRTGARYCRLCGWPMQGGAGATLLIEGATPGARARFFLGEGAMVLGRQSGGQRVDLDLGPLDPDAYVSRRHARILYDRGRYWIADLGSANGTFVNGRRLTPSQAEPLQEGDRIRLGRVELVFTQR